MKAWLLILELTTGQIAILDAPSEERCRYMLEAINSGAAVAITLRDGLRLPIAPQGGIGCFAKEAFEAEEADLS